MSGEQLCLYRQYIGWLLNLLIKCFPQSLAVFELKITVLYRTFSNQFFVCPSCLFMILLSRTLLHPLLPIYILVGFSTTIPRTYIIIVNKYILCTYHCNSLYRLYRKTGDAYEKIRVSIDCTYTVGCFFT